MQTATLKASGRYQLVSREKAHGATYTPTILSDFVADQMLEAAELPKDVIRVLDPAVGDGELLVSLLRKLTERTQASIIVHGFDTNIDAVAEAQERLSAAFPNATIKLEHGDFLSFVASTRAPRRSLSLFEVLNPPEPFDLVIANPPYVRTQILGSVQAQILGRAFNLTGRVDVYHAFLIGMSQVLGPGGTAGIIVSNRFMTTKAGSTLRSELRKRLTLRHIWDLGDTKLFEAAVLPAVILAHGHHLKVDDHTRFSSIYETGEQSSHRAATPIAALSLSGNISVEDGRRFRVQHGKLETRGASNDIWRIATDALDEWLETVAKNTWKTFGEIGKIRVGVKTCADKVFIRHDWHEMPEEDVPELLRPLTTHHIGDNFRAIQSNKRRMILYPHEAIDGRKQAVDLRDYPKAGRYLEKHRHALEGRGYVLEGGRRWYEIWVPQDPRSWEKPKLVFRDISHRPMFWLDLAGTVVNGDCYWLTAQRQQDEELLWLAAAVANSSFIESFYDHRFNNKLYAGRRRFITQYVERFPLPDGRTALARTIISMAKAIYECAGSEQAARLARELDTLIWQAFGLPAEEIRR